MARVRQAGSISLPMKTGSYVRGKTTSSCYIVTNITKSSCDVVELETGRIVIDEDQLGYTVITDPIIIEP